MHKALGQWVNNQRREDDGARIAQLKGRKTYYLARRR